MKKIIMFSYSLFYTVLWKLFGPLKYLLWELGLISLISGSCTEPDQKHASMSVYPPSNTYTELKLALKRSNTNVWQRKEYILVWITVMQSQKKILP